VTGRALATILPILLFGVEAGHAVAHRLVGDPDARADLLASSSTQQRLLPLLLAVAVVAAVVGAGARSASRWVFAALPPVFFLAIEVVEAVVDGRFSSTEPALWLGLALQLPFALLVWVAVRLLRTVVAAVVRASVPQVLHVSPLFARPACATVRAAAIAGAQHGRAPPRRFVCA
jgi:glucan phosphoethanolaminetransferase (alkaline phosphatase superfamily)